MVEMKQTSFIYKWTSDAYDENLIARNGFSLTFFFQWLHVCQHNKALMFFKGVSSKTFQKYLAITCKLIFADLPKRH